MKSTPWPRSSNIRGDDKAGVFAAVLDVVELVTDSGRWPAGPVGTVVEVDDRSALVEISGIERIADQLVRRDDSLARSRQLKPT